MNYQEKKEILSLMEQTLTELNQYHILYNLVFSGSKIIFQIKPDKFRKEYFNKVILLSKTYLSSKESYYVIQNINLLDIEESGTTTTKGDNIKVAYSIFEEWIYKSIQEYRMLPKF